MKSPVLSVEEALARILADAKPTTTEPVSLKDAAGRTLSQSLKANLTQPPFDASAMDGYAVRKLDVAALPATLRVIGEAAAGHPFDSPLETGQAVRIFTGAPLPQGADAVVIQENTTRDGDRVTIAQGQPDPGHVRPRGGDFCAGAVMIEPGTRLEPRHISLAAASGHADLNVHRKPVVAILATGDELVPPGTTPGPGQIVASNSYAIAAMATRAGAETRLLDIAKDTLESLAARLHEAKDADILVTIGGASVGDHDLVSPALKAAGYQMDFWKIAMRPGKPLMFAHKDHQRAIGLPGNPVSSIICSHIFLLPLIASLSGSAPQHTSPIEARLTTDLEQNGPRQHYMRGALKQDAEGNLWITPAHSQDSSLLSVLAHSNALIVRKPHEPSRTADEKVTVLRIDF